ncbi:MAG: hypothetical protein ABI162_00795 [Luteolibacter sp.]
MPQNSSALAIIEENNHARHIFTSAVGWFTLFTTANYITIGWVAGKDSSNEFTLKVAAILFIFQNFIGFYALCVTYKYFNESNERIASYHDIHYPDHKREDPSDYYPKPLYLKMVLCMIVAMGTIGLTWIFILASALVHLKLGAIDRPNTNQAAQVGGGNSIALHASPLTLRK